MMREFMNKHTFLYMATELATDHDMKTVTAVVAVVFLTFSMFLLLHFLFFRLISHSEAGVIFQ